MIKMYGLIHVAHDSFWFSEVTMNMEFEFFTLTVYWPALNLLKSVTKNNWDASKTKGKWPKMAFVAFIVM